MKEQIERLRANIRAACQRVHRAETEITIVAASKTVPWQTLAELEDSGIFICGENRVQELMDKYGRFETTWHMIGRLQTNKVKYLIGKVALIQSLDRIELAAEIERQCQRHGKTVDCLVEVNIGGEDSKGGIAPEELELFLEELKQFPSVRLKGLMTIAPNTANPDDNRPLFLKMKALYDYYRGCDELGCSQFDTLSMGMSGDYVQAIECGSTMIRPGRAIFGERIYLK